MGRLCFSIVRSLIIIENLIVLTLASFVIYISFTGMDQDFGMDSLNDNHPKSVHAYMTAISSGVGIIIALLSILGLFGALKKSKSVLSMYAIIIFFMVAILAVMAVITLTMRTTGVVYRDLDKTIVNTTVNAYSHTDNNDYKLTTKFFDYIQKRLSCCGINSPNDWKDYGQLKIPKTCCTTHIESAQPLPFKYCEQSEFKVGCWRAFTDYTHANLSTVRLILYIIIAFGLVCCLAAFSMARFIKRSLEVV